LVHRLSKEDSAAKPFSESEIELIRQKLIESCLTCWERYGYRKTIVAQLCEMASISTGAFYSFYPSKEMLFVKAADAFSDGLIEKIRSGAPKNPTKRDFCDCLNRTQVKRTFPIS
jgi:AcrR family transcriptional regulator